MTATPEPAVARAAPAPPPASASAAVVPRAAAVVVGMRIAAARARERRTFAPRAVAVLLALVSGLVERRVGSNGAVDRALMASFSLVVPLVAFFEVGFVAAPRNLRDAAWPVARFGAPRSAVALGFSLVAAIASALSSLVVALVTVLAAHGPGSRPLAQELPICAVIGVLAGLSYAALFALGATFGRGGRGRHVLLAFDLAFGHVVHAGLGALPRGHVTSLLGGGAALGLGQRASMAVLVGFTVVLLGLVQLRTRD